MKKYILTSLLLIGIIICSIAFAVPVYAMQQIIIGGNDDHVSDTATEYNTIQGGTDWNTVASNRLQIIPTSGTISDLFIEISTSPGSGDSLVFTLMVDGSPSSLEVTLSESETTDSDVTHEVDVVAGQQVCLRCDPDGSLPSTIEVHWSLRFTGDTSNESIILGMGQESTSSTLYFPASVGFLYTDTTNEFDAEQVIPTDGYLKKLYVETTSDPGTDPDAYDYTLRVNGADSDDGGGNPLEVTIVADNTTGNDTSHSIDVTAGDLVCLEVTPVNTPSAESTFGWGMVFLADTDGESLILGNNAYNTALTTSYTWVNSVQADYPWDSSYQDVDQGCQSVATLKNLYVAIEDAPGSSATVTYSLGCNAGSATGLTVTLTGTSETSGNDTTHEYITNDYDNLFMKRVEDAGAPTPTEAHWGLVCYMNPLLSYYNPSGNTGNWTNPTYAYSTDDSYATRDPVVTVTNSPTANTGSAWTDPTYAYSDGSDEAYIESGNPSSSNVWDDYGFSFTGTVTQVRVRYDAWTEGNTSGYETITLRSGDTSGGGDTDGLGDFTVTKPSSVSDGDYLVCIVGIDDDGGGDITSTGWTREYASTSTGNDVSVAILYKKITSASGEPSTYTVSTGDSGEEYYYWCGALDGIDQSTPEDVAFSGGWTNVQNQDTFTATEITTNTDGAYVFAIAYVDYDDTITNPSSPWGTLLNNGLYSSNNLNISSKTQSSAGLTGDASFTDASNDDGYVGQFAFRPAVAYVYDEQIKIDVTWDNGSSWSSVDTQTLTVSETTYWFDVTSETAWTATKLNNTNFQVRALAQTVGSSSEVYLDWLPVEVTYYETTNLDHTWTTYGIDLTGETIDKVEVGFEAYADSSEKLDITVTWDGGSSWATPQTSDVLAGSDSNAVTWFDFTSATTWTPTLLNNTNFQVKVTYNDQGSHGEAYLDWLPVRITVTSGTDISNTPSSKGFGIVETSTTYWSSGSEPSWPLTDGDAYWTLTNNSSGAVDIDFSMTNFTGGNGWTLVSGSPGADQVRITIFIEGDGSGDGVVLTTSPQELITALAASADIDYEMKFETGSSHSDGVAKTSTMTLDAALS